MVQITIFSLNVGREILKSNIKDFADISGYKWYNIYVAPISKQIFEKSKAE